MGFGISIWWIGMLSVLFQVFLGIKWWSAVDSGIVFVYSYYPGILFIRLWSA
jgi:hypothetical protein